LAVVTKAKDLEACQWELAVVTKAKDLEAYQWELAWVTKKRLHGITRIRSWSSRYRVQGVLLDWGVTAKYARHLETQPNTNQLPPSHNPTSTTFSL
jgi:hypothetical protein